MKNYEKERKLGVIVHSVTLALRRLRQEDHTFEVSLGHIIIPCLREEVKKEEKRREMGRKKKGKGKKVEEKGGGVQSFHPLLKNPVPGSLVPYGLFLHPMGSKNRKCNVYTLCESVEPPVVWLGISEVQTRKSF